MPQTRWRADASADRTEHLNNESVVGGDHRHHAGALWCRGEPQGEVARPVRLRRWPPGVGAIRAWPRSWNPAHLLSRRTPGRPAPSGAPAAAWWEAGLRDRTAT